MVMKRQNLRVIVASEYSEAQDFLQGVVEEERGVVTVGKAKDAHETLALARNLRPDVAIIDFYLPHVSGFDTIPLSRIGGLDTAQTIFEEIPNTKVILLNNVETGVSPGRSLDSDNDAIYSIVSEGTNVPFVLQALSNKLVPPRALVFAAVEVKPGKPLRLKGASLPDKAIFWGGLGIAGGWLLTITVMFAPAGVPLALVGMITFSFGLAGKLTPKLWHRLFRKRAKL